MDDEKRQQLDQARDDRALRAHKRLFFIMQAAMLIGFAGAIYERQWLNGATIFAIMVIMFVPSMIERRLRVHIPPEFEIAALLFVFAALFLGEVRDYYAIFWWWDIALHVTSGFLLGIFGFLLVYVLNETDRVNLHMRPHFVALFAFCFAMTMGTLWEIFEFAMDSILGKNMQKPMLGDPSGLTDTMWDLIVDAIGALVVGALGWMHMVHRRESFVGVWIRKFVERNPRLFRR